MKANTHTATPYEERRLTASHKDVDLIASGYECCCPSCDILCNLIEIPREGDVVECPKCDTIFTVGLAEHAYR